MKSIIDPNRKQILLTPDTIKPAMCLDLDGTVRYSKSGEFINKPEDIALFEGVEDVLWKHRNVGYLIFGITNQGGVAYGHKLPADVDAEIDATIRLFRRNPFHIIKSCLHHPQGTSEPFNHRSLMRKPYIGMLVVCEIDAWERGIIVDWDNSFFVGDREEDRQCAQNADIPFYWANEFFQRAVK